MNTVGIIAEYNPFHEGHAYHLRRAKEAAGADFAVVILNGDFVQRGEPAVCDKYVRAKAALEGGADLVFELPVRFGLSSAGDFALGGILALTGLGFVSHVCFGSECGELAPLWDTAALLAEETDEFRAALDAALRQGLSYPAARASALAQTSACPEEMLRQPNNILGIEYCLAIQRTGSHLTPLTIRREGQDYHGREGADADGYPSATALRRKIYSGRAPHLRLNDFSDMIGYALRTCPSLEQYKDVSPELADTIRKRLPDFRLAEEFAAECQSRTFTAGRIRRALLQCLLGIRSLAPSMPYLRLLGMRREASVLLVHRENIPCAVLSRLAVDAKSLSDPERLLLEQDILASDLYRQVYGRKYGEDNPNEYQHSPIIWE